MTTEVKIIKNQVGLLEAMNKRMITIANAAKASFGGKSIDKN